MDAVIYNIEAKRLCETHRGCMGCPAFAVNEGCRLYRISAYFDPEEAVRIVEEWSKEHPIQTNGNKFREVFGDAFYGECPSSGFWMSWWDAPYEAPEGE